MNKLNFEIELNETAKVILIKNKGNSIFTIEYEKDINFTQLIDYLAKLMDGSELIEHNEFQETEDKKALIVFKMISHIFDKFNKIQIESIENTDG